MKYLAEDIIHELQDLIEVQLEYLNEKVVPLPEEDLNWKPGRHRWNIFEVIEHLNRFGDFYLPKVANMVAHPKSFKKDDNYKSGFFGEFAFKRVRPLDGVVPYKAKALGNTTPFLRKLDRSVIKDHVGQQNKLLGLIRGARDVNLSKNSIPTMLASWFRLNLGDSMRIVVYHTERHYVQINNLVDKSDI